MKRHTTFGTCGKFTAVIILLAGLSFTPGAVSADVVTFEVTTSMGLRSAIDFANSGLSPNVSEVNIKLAQGTYTLTGAASEEDDDNAAGDFDIRPGGNITTVTIEPDGAGATVIIDGSGTFRIFDVFPRADQNLAIHLNRLNIQNGGADGYGGGIFIRPSTAASVITVNMADVNVRNNSAQDSGGGIAIGPGSNLEFIDGAIVENFTAFNGGGVFCFGGSANFYNTQMVYNLAAPPSTGIGGGAVFNAGCTIIIDDASMVANNTTAEDGLFVYGGAVAHAGFGTTTVSAAIIADANSGSGIYNQFGDMIINFPGINPDLPGDAIILAGSVTFNITGVLTILGDLLVQPAGEFIVNGRIRLTKAMPWLPLLLLDD